MSFLFGKLINSLSLTIATRRHVLYVWNTYRLGRSYRVISVVVHGNMKIRISFTIQCDTNFKWYRKFVLVIPISIALILRFSLNLSSLSIQGINKIYILWKIPILRCFYFFWNSWKWYVQLCKKACKRYYLKSINFRASNFLKQYMIGAFFIFFEIFHESMIIFYRAINFLYIP